MIYLLCSSLWYVDNPTFVENISVNQRFLPEQNVRAVNGKNERGLSFLAFLALFSGCALAAWQFQTANARFFLLVGMNLFASQLTRATP
jgi:hypothetical protein